MARLLVGDWLAWCLGGLVAGWLGVLEAWWIDGLDGLVARWLGGLMS